MSTFRTFQQISEIDAIKRADTVREIRQVNPAFVPGEFDMRESRTPSLGGWLALIASGLVGSLLMWIFLVIVLGWTS